MRAAGDFYAARCFRMRDCLVSRANRERVGTARMQRLLIDFADFAQEKRSRVPATSTIVADGRVELASAMRTNQSPSSGRGCFPILLSECHVREVTKIMNQMSTHLLVRPGQVSRCCLGVPMSLCCNISGSSSISGLGIAFVQSA